MELHLLAGLVALDTPRQPDCSGGRELVWREICFTDRTSCLRFLHTYVVLYNLHDG